MSSPSYELIDSGNLMRLERFGERILARPATLCVWKQRDPALWQGADATYNHERGWSFRKAEFSEWALPLPFGKMKLRLQRNGQIGFFPEHSLYLDRLGAAIASRSPSAENPVRMLSLFAFTGQATLCALQAGATVTHVDMLKQALDWTRENIEASGIASPTVRLIPEEALVYLGREQRRGSQYELILLDPPSFSRIDKNKEWQLDDVLPELVASTAALIPPSGGEMFFTSHHTEQGGTVVENLYRDALGTRIKCVTVETLRIPETGSLRTLPAGYLTRIVVG